jgi:sortase A
MIAVSPMIALRRLLLICALALFAYCAFVIVETQMFQRRETRALEALLRRPAAPGPSGPDSVEGLVGRIRIPRLGVSVIVMEGSTEAVLRHAAGHIEGTAMPGQEGNVGISAHRDTFFRPLRNIRKDDLIDVTTPLGNFRYRVVSTRIVPPSEVSVLNPGPIQILTLVTCYPFYFVGSAPDRFIVRAERIT